MRTPRSWFQHHRRTAQRLDIEVILRAFATNPKEGAQYLLLPMDGFRALSAQCLELDGGVVVLSDDPPCPENFSPRPSCD